MLTIAVSCVTSNGPEIDHAYCFSANAEGRSVQCQGITLYRMGITRTEARRTRSRVTSHW